MGTQIVLPCARGGCGGEMRLDVDWSITDFLADAGLFEHMARATCCERYRGRYHSRIRTCKLGTKCNKTEHYAYHVLPEGSWVAEIFFDGNCKRTVFVFETTSDAKEMHSWTWNVTRACRSPASRVLMPRTTEADDTNLSISHI
jgi:hypothetical protein